MNKDKLADGIEPITSLKQIVDLGFTPAKGRKPATSEKIEVLARGGFVFNGTYESHQIDWTKRDHPFGAVGWRIAK